MLGTGVAGLTAALALAQSGLRVVILEASDRVGVPILSEQPAGRPMAIEIGPAFGPAC